MTFQVRRAQRLAPAVAEPQGATTLFTEDFGTGNFNKWNSLQWSTSGVVRNTTGSAYSGTGEYSCELVAIDGRTNVARFELRDGDIPFAGTERSEIGEPTPTVSMESFVGAERWMAWDMKFHSTWPVPHPSSSWTLIWQWHPQSSSLGSPALCMDIDTDDVIYLSNNDASGYQKTAVQAVQRNVWQRWIVHAVFSDNLAVGYADVWVDGVKKINHEARRTMVVGDTSSYHKTGIYRDPVNTATAILYIDNIKMTTP